MSRITIRNKILHGLVAVVIFAAGCSGDYKQKQLGDDSPQAVQVRAMIASLRQAGLERLDETMRQQVAEGLNRRQKAGLRAMLTEIILVEKVKLHSLDRFGQSVCRATLELSEGGQQSKVFVLLVENQGNLRWAGRN
ncbi:MAG: hypothetical protein K8R91_04535 [Phycisphaerae bacterium]|nr:hypothetical protein [Phycisphaerae bacterium]